MSTRRRTDDKGNPVLWSDQECSSLTTRTGVRTRDEGVSVSWSDQTGDSHVRPRIEKHESKTRHVSWLIRDPNPHPHPSHTEHINRRSKRRQNDLGPNLIGPNPIPSVTLPHLPSGGSVEQGFPSLGIIKPTHYHMMIHTRTTLLPFWSPYLRTSPITGVLVLCYIVTEVNILSWHVVVESSLFLPPFTPEKEIVTSTHFRTVERFEPSRRHSWRPKKSSFLTSVGTRILPDNLWRKNERPRLPSGGIKTHLG